MQAPDILYKHNEVKADSMMKQLPLRKELLNAIHNFFLFHIEIKITPTVYV